MIDIILKSIYFMAPVYFANMAPVLVKNINFLDYPIDFNKRFRGEPILGNHKTWRGLFFGVIAGIVSAYIQYRLFAYLFFAGISIIDYSDWLVIGFLLGFGALFGDLVKSFFKRRLDIKPGRQFIPWDQLDYTIGSLLLISVFYVPSAEIIVSVLIINFLLHVIANHLAYYLRLSKVKW